MSLTVLRVRVTRRWDSGIGAWLFGSQAIFLSDLKTILYAT